MPEWLTFGKVYVAVGMTVTLVFVALCAKNQVNTGDCSNDLPTWMCAENTIVQTSPTSQISGNLSGGFLFAVGAVDGHVSSDTKLRFTWQAPGGIGRTTTLPYDKIQWDFDHASNPPTVRFVWNGLQDKDNLKAEDPSQVLADSGLLDHAVIRISKEEFQSEKLPG